MAAVVTDLTERLRQKIGMTSTVDTAVNQDYSETISDFSPEDEPKYSDDGSQAFIKSISIGEAYTKWCGKSKLIKNGEGYQVSCPDPNHADKNPSTSLNIKNNVFTCYRDPEISGDIIDMFALTHGYSVPAYKQDKEQFKQVRKELLEDMGWEPPQVTALRKMVEESEEERPDDLPPEEDVEIKPEAKALANVDPIDIDWRSIVPEGTYLHTRMINYINSRPPDNFHFFAGLVELAFLAGRDHGIAGDNDEPIFPTMFVTLVADSTVGKSRAIKPIESLMQEVMPFKSSQPGGVESIIGAASGQALVNAFRSQESINGQIVEYPVKALIRYDEFAELVSRASYKGSTLTHTLMALSDGAKRISDVTKGSGKIIANDPFACMISTTQPAMLEKLFSREDAGSGIINRYIIVRANAKQDKATWREHIDKVAIQEKYEDLMSWMLTDCPKVMMWEQDAEELLEDWYINTFVPDRNQTEYSKAILGRIDMHIRKITHLFCINENLTTVTRDVFERVIQLYPFIKASLGVVQDSVRESDEGEWSSLIAERAEEYRAEKGTWPTLNQLHKYKLKGKIKSLRNFKDACDQAEKFGLIAIISAKPNGPGRPGGPKVFKMGSKYLEKGNK